MKFWTFVNATARLIRRVKHGIWQIKAKFIRLLDDWAYPISHEERLLAQAYILNY